MKDSKIVTARKVHKCDLCGEKITKRMRYWRHTLDGDYQNTRKEHINCLDLKAGQ